MLSPLIQRDGIAAPGPGPMGECSILSLSVETLWHIIGYILPGKEERKYWPRRLKDYTRLPQCRHGWQQQCRTLRLTCRSLSRFQPVVEALFHDFYLHPTEDGLDRLRRLCSSPYRHVVRRVILVRPLFIMPKGLDHEAYYEKLDAAIALTCAHKFSEVDTQVNHVEECTDLIAAAAFAMIEKELEVEGFEDCRRALRETAYLLESGEYVDRCSRYLPGLSQLHSVVMRGGMCMDVDFQGPSVVSSSECLASGTFLQKDPSSIVLPRKPSWPESACFMVSILRILATARTNLEEFIFTQDLHCPLYLAPMSGPCGVSTLRLSSLRCLDLTVHAKSDAATPCDLVPHHEIVFQAICSLEILILRYHGRYLVPILETRFPKLRTFLLSSKRFPDGERFGAFITAQPILESIELCDMFFSKKAFRAMVWALHMKRTLVRINFDGTVGPDRDARSRVNVCLSKDPRDADKNRLRGDLADYVAGECGWTPNLQKFFGTMEPQMGVNETE